LHPILRAETHETSYEADVNAVGAAHHFADIGANGGNFTEFSKPRLPIANFTGAESSAPEPST
jgi:trans-aconitate methyltransferase